MSKKTIFFVLMGLVLATAGVIASVFRFPEPVLLTQIMGKSTEQQSYCFNQPAAKVSLDNHLDNNGQLDVVAWNIFKQGNSDWQKDLTTFKRSAQLLLIQESQLNQELRQTLSDFDYYAYQVSAFEFMGKPTGVLTLSSQQANQTCGYIANEPWLRLPKSALISYYELSNGKTLATVNLHAINFTLSTQKFKAQLSKLNEKLSLHQGPIIIGGDFNSWSEGRWQDIRQVMARLHMQEVQFEPDNRRRFINGMPLDHIFFRELKVRHASAPQVTSSDHNPLLVSFSI